MQERVITMQDSVVDSPRRLFMERQSQKKVLPNMGRSHITPSYLRALRAAALISSIVRPHKEDVSVPEGTKIGGTRKLSEPPPRLRKSSQLT